MRRRIRPDETGPLPQFSLDDNSDVDRTTEWRGRLPSVDDLELIEERSDTGIEDEPPSVSIAPVAMTLESSELEDEEVSAELELEEEIALPTRRVPWKPFAIAAGVLAFASGIATFARSTSAGDAFALASS